MKTNLILFFLVLIFVNTLAVEVQRSSLRRKRNSVQDEDEETKTKRKLIWLDSDPGINVGVVDDAIAIIVAGKHANVKLLGISTVAGNTDVDNCNKNALNILNMADIDVPVVAGSTKPLIRERYVDNTESPTFDFPAHNKEIASDDALQYMYHVFSRRQQKVTFVALGPCTNIALLLKAYPDVVDYIEEIVVLGGAMGVGNMSPAAEFNIWSDPDAAKMVFHSDIKTTVITMDLTYSTAMTQEIFQNFEDNQSSEFGDFLWTFINYKKETQPDLFWQFYSMFHDAVAVVYAIEPSLFTLVSYNVDIELKSKLSYGRTLFDVYGVTGNAANVNYASAVNSTAYWDIVMTIVNEIHEESLASASSSA